MYKTIHQYYVYILASKKNGTLYIGVTNDLERRFGEHQSGKNKDCYTYNKRPLELMWFETFNDVLNAIAIEKQIKGWSRIKKEALITQDWDRLVLFSKNYTQFGNPNDLK